MASIPTTINSVTIEFGVNVINSVDHKVIDALKHIIDKDISKTHTLTKIYISSAKDQHNPPSRHVQGEGKAVDISRINGNKISISYPSDPAVKSIVEEIQLKFESYQHRRENFGPFLKKKAGIDFSIRGHNDHIHISVN